MMLKPWWAKCLLIVVLCYGCQSVGTAVDYYTLQSSREAVKPAENKQLSQWVVGLGPLELPDYLDRFEIITRTSPNRLDINEGHRWAGPLKSEITRILAADLERLTGVNHVAVFPWTTSTEPDLRFRIKIHTFEGRPGGTVKLKASWSLTPAQSQSPALRRVTHIEEQVRGNRIEDMITAMGIALSGLSREMADAVGKAGSQ